MTSLLGTEGFPRWILKQRLVANWEDVSRQPEWEHTKVVQANSQQIMEEVPGIADMVIGSMLDDPARQHLVIRRWTLQ